jgi:hypothetical protein
VTATARAPSIGTSTATGTSADERRDDPALTPAWLAALAHEPAGS